jgi:type I restriction-modification system DNA methylase subunit
VIPVAVKNNDSHGKTLDVPALESWLWEAAGLIRGPVDAPKFKDYTLPLIFLKRLSDVFDDEVARLGREFGDAGKALSLIEEDHKLVRFFLAQKARWAEIALAATGLGEYLLRKFAEGQGQSAGEFYTPRGVAVLMARVLDPQPGQTIYDPCCGSGGLLIKAHLRLVEKFGDKTNGSRRLPPSRYVSVGEAVEVLPLDETVVQLREGEEGLEAANRELEKVLRKLGLA